MVNADSTPPALSMHSRLWSSMGHGEVGGWPYDVCAAVARGEGMVMTLCLLRTQLKRTKSSEICRLHCLRMSPLRVAA